MRKCNSKFFGLKLAGRKKERFETIEQSFQP
jgi:hypothetical protein